jgi:hypothetical protein
MYSSLNILRKILDLLESMLLCQEFVNVFLCKTLISITTSTRLSILVIKKKNLIMERYSASG